VGVWLLLAGLVAPAVCPPTPPRAAPPANRPHYRMTVTANRGLSTVAGSLSVRFAPTRPTDRIVFRLWPNSPHFEGEGAALAVSGVRVAGRRSIVQRPDPTTLVVRAGRLPGGQHATVSMRWRLSLPVVPNERLSRRGSALRLGSFFPLLAYDPQRGWALDPPTSTPAEASTSPTADFDVRVRVPRGLTVLASGDELGRGRWRARAVRDFAVAAGRFELASRVVRAGRTVRVKIGVLKGSGAPAPGVFLQRAAASLEALASLYGPYAWPTFRLAVFADLTRSGIEYPQLIFQGPQSLDRATPHEAGHMWFYSLVGNDQARDPWLDESLATWAAGRVDGITNVFASWPLPPDARGHLGEPMTYWDHHFDSYFAGVYAQGVRALSDLGEPERVDCALRLYAAQQAYRIARPGNLVAALRRFFPNAPAVLARYGVRP
jgi:hypothetical protein